MRLGIISPVLTQVPGAHSEWERGAGIEELGRIAEDADRLGFAHLTCSEHIAVPTEVAAQRGGTYWDPLATFGYLAARTSSIRFATQVLVVGYHHPLAIAKRYGTLDRVTGGRLVLGLGVGSLAEEFELLGASFADRGPRADERIDALRGALSTPKPEFHGRFHDFAGLVVEPHAVQARVPIWVGGRTRRSLRRALARGDGWVPFGLGSGELAAMLADTDLPAGFEVVLDAGRPLDPISAPDAARGALRRRVAAGATTVNVRIAASSAEHYREQLDALRVLGAELGTTAGGAGA